MHCSSSAEMLSLPQVFRFGRSLITASISSLHIYLVLHFTHINDIIFSSVFIPIQFFHILSPSLHYFIFSIKTFPCLPLIVCSPLSPFGRSSLIFWYINWLCALSNISISLHISS